MGHSPLPLGSSLTVTLGSGHTTPPCSVDGWGWQPSTVKPHHPVRLQTTVGEIHHLLEQQAPQTCVKHEIAQWTVVVLLNPPRGRSSMWAPSPMPFSFLPTMFPLYIVLECDKMPKINSLKRVNVYFGSQFQPCWLQGACPCCFVGEESVHRRSWEGDKDYFESCTLQWPNFLQQGPTLKFPPSFSWGPSLQHGYLGGTFKRTSHH